MGEWGKKSCHVPFGYVSPLSSSASSGLPQALASSLRPNNKGVRRERSDVRRTESRRFCVCAYVYSSPFQNSRPSVNVEVWGCAIKYEYNYRWVWAPPLFLLTPQKSLCVSVRNLSPRLN